jgi:hypothetical protein
MVWYYSEKKTKNEAALKKSYRNVSYIVQKNWVPYHQPNQTAPNLFVLPDIGCHWHHEKIYYYCNSSIVNASMLVLVVVEKLRNEKRKKC